MRQRERKKHRDRDTHTHTHTDMEVRDGLCLTPLIFEDNMDVVARACVVVSIVREVVADSLVLLVKWISNFGVKTLC